MTFKRLEELKKIVDVIHKFADSQSPHKNISLLHVQMKQYIHWPMYVLFILFFFVIICIYRSNQAKSGDLLRQMLERDYPVDGLIFTPDAPYPTGKTARWASLLKWKGNKSTVDLYVKRNEKERRWDLYVCGNFATITRDRTRCLIFKRVTEDDSNTNTNTNNHNFWVVTENGLIVQQSSRDITRAEKRSAILFPFMPHLPIGYPLEDATVFEFYWDAYTNSLQHLSKRIDKSAQGINGANDLTVAVDVWESMKYPVTKEQLLQLPNIETKLVDKSFGSYPYAKDIHQLFDWNVIFESQNGKLAVGGPSKSVAHKNDVEYYKMRRLHNQIKETIIRKASQTTKQVSEHQRLYDIGGKLLQGESAKWSLPNNAQTKQKLENEWGLQTEIDCTDYGDRLHVYETTLKKHRPTLSIVKNARSVKF